MSYKVYGMIKVNGILQPGYKTPQEIADYLNKKQEAKKPA
jgi:hypothetical protein